MNRQPKCGCGLLLSKERQVDGVIVCPRCEEPHVAEENVWYRRGGLGWVKSEYQDSEDD